MSTEKVYTKRSNTTKGIKVTNSQRGLKNMFLNVLSASIPKSPVKYMWSNTIYRNNKYTRLKSEKPAARFTAWLIVSEDRSTYSKTGKNTKMKGYTPRVSHVVGNGKTSPPFWMNIVPSWKEDANPKIFRSGYTI